MGILKNISRVLLCLGIALSVPLGHAADIDIYARPPTTTPDPTLNPNVLIVIDNSANWASANQHWPGGIKQGESELKAVRTVISELNASTNVGLMMFTKGTGSNQDGGYIRFAIRPMTAVNKSAFSELVGYASGCTDGPNSLNGTPNCILKNFNGSEKVATASYSRAMLDVFKYFGGYTWPMHAQDNVAGANVNASQFGTMRYAGDPDPNSDPAAYTTDANKTSYISALSALNNCSKNYVIFIGNGFPPSSTEPPSTLLGPPSLLPNQGVGGDVTQLPLANLTVTTSTLSTLLATPACGTYSGSTASASLSACNTDATLSTQYPGYSSYACTSNSTCSAGSTTTSTTNLGTSACGAYASQAACQTAITTLFPGHSSYSCTSQTACSSNSANSSIVATTACISDSLNNAANCTSYGNTNYPSYAGFTCNSVANCGSTGKQWRIDATTKITTGNTYTMNGINTSTVSSTTFSQYINGTYTMTAGTPNGTFSAPSKINYLDEWARFLYQTDVSPATGKQNVNTFTIDVFKDQQDLNESSLLISAAQAGGGKYYNASDETGIANALRRIFSEIQSVNSVFASSSLPVSVNTQGTYLNQVFMGMFRPDGTASPRWPGNLKQYQFKLFNGVLKLADKKGLDAINSSTGFITPCANSFWSTDTGQYWNYGGAVAVGDCTVSDQASAFPVAGSTSAYSDAPDGEVVEKGGAAQRLRGEYSSGGTLVSSSMNYQLCIGTQTPATAQCRMLETCDGTSTTSCTSLTSFDPTNTTINATTLNLANATQVNSLIWWTRGQDVDNENSNFNALLVPITTEMRPSAHGGVVHSQPAVIDYGGTIGTVAFYGDDQGVFHAVDGNQADTDGIELWGFIAPEFYSKLNRQRTNSPAIAYPGVTGSPAPLPKDYFFDGSVGVYQNSAAGKVWIFPSMRRGGRAIYAFDVSIPTSPVLKWRKGCFTEDTTNDICSAGWAGIGQTWSSPHIVFLSGYVDGSGVQKPVLIFGGGYDQCEDTNSQTRCTTPPRKGANIWFVDADTGAILRTYPTNYSVSGDVAPLKDGNGNLTFVYAADTGGNVYRINVATTNSTGTTFTSWSNNSAASDIILASFSETNQARKFINGPAIVPTANYNAVMIGSGDREHPLVTDYACNNYSTTTGAYVTNQFYMLMDRPTGYPNAALTPSSLVDVTNGTTTSTTAAGVTTITNSVGPASSTNGWRFNFGQCEQTVNEALTIAGTTFFGTNAPKTSTGSSCSANLGFAYGYAVDYLTGNATGGARSAEYVGGGMPPSPVAGVVEVDGVKYPFCIGCIDTNATNSSALQGGKVNINPTGSRYRSYWYRESD